MKRIWAICALVVCTLPAIAEAQQVVQRPTRPYRGLFGGARPPDPNRVHQELTLNSSGLFGYDDYLTPGSQGQSGEIDPGQPGVSGGTALVDAQLQYWVGKATTFFSTDFRTRWTGYGGVDADPTLGADLAVSAQTQAGRRNVVQFNQTLSFEPSLVLAAFQPLAEDIGSTALPESGVGSGFVGQRSRSNNTSANLEHRWSAKHATSAGASYFQRTYLDELGYDSNALSADVQHTTNVNRSSTFGGSYSYSDSEFQDPSGFLVPLTEHTASAEAGYRRRLSRTRQMEISGGMGATFVKTVNAGDYVPQSYWTPAAHALFRYDIGRSWALGADYRRAVNVLQGVSLETFATNAFNISADGVVGQRIEMAFSTALSMGSTTVGEDFGRYEAYSGSAQLRYALARNIAVSTVYDYYYYRLRDVARPLGLPPEYDRNAVRVGVTVWLPLLGSFSGGRDGR
jgi:hypothetical protein